MDNLLNGQQARAILAGGAFWAWYDLSQVHSLYARSLAEWSELLLAISLVVGVAPLLIVALGKKGLIESAGNRKIQSLIGAFAMAGSLMEYLGYTKQVLVLVVSGSLVVGVCSGCFIAILATIYGTHGARATGILISGSFILEAVIDIVILALPIEVASIAVALLPILSIAILPSSMFDKAGALPQSRQQPLQSPSSNECAAPAKLIPTLFNMSISLLVSLICYWFAFGYFQHWSSNFETALGFHYAIIVFATRGGISLVFFLGSIYFRTSQQRMLQTGMLIMIAGFFVMPFTAQFDEAIPSSTVFTMAGYALFDIMTWVVLTNIASYRTLNPPKVICLGMALASAAMGAGYGLASTILTIAENPGITNAFTTSITYLLVVGAVLILVNLSKIWNRMDGENSATAEALQADLRAMGEAFGLTNREIDVFELLVSQSTTTDIAKRLYITSNTLNTHVKRIYTKLGVHSRNELKEHVASWLS